MQINLPQMYGKQYDAFYHGKGVGVTEACTKAGKTVGALVWQADRVLRGGPYPNHWWVAPVYPQAKIAYERAVRMFRGVYSSCTESPYPIIRFRNGHLWHFKSAEKPDNLYGEDVADAVFDEFTRARQKAYTALVSTVTATAGPINLIGNVRGRGWGWSLAQQAKSDESMHYTMIDADDAMAAKVITPEAVARAKSQMPEDDFLELYYCIPSDSGGNPFGIANIAECAQPPSEDETAFWGVDLAKSHDWTVCWGTDRRGRWTEIHRWQKSPWNETKERVGRIIGSTPTVMDATGVGNAITDELIAAGHNITPFSFTSSTKQHLMGQLRMAIQDGATTLPDDADKGRDSARIEHESFEYGVSSSGVVRYEAPEGLHDDFVDAHALAVEARMSMPSIEPGFLNIDLPVQRNFK